MTFTALRTRSCFRRVVGQGQARRRDGIVLHWLNNNLEANRYGIAAKLAVGKAVVRNRVRRWGRELLRRWNPALRPGYDLVLSARQPEAADDYHEFCSNLASLLARAELIEHVLELSE